MSDSEREIPELLLVDKPSGISSFDVIRRLRRELSVRKMGHAGTLDPLASGLMLIGVGQGTKKLSGYVGLSKVYEAEVRFGLKTDTGDRTGAVVEECTIDGVRKERIESALQDMVGVNRYPVPAYSATKQGGERLYKKARRGERVVVPLRDMEVYEAELLSYDMRDEVPYARIHFFVESGTYIRSLAEALGEKVGSCATVSELRRTRVGEFSVEDARGV